MINKKETLLFGLLFMVLVFSCKRDIKNKQHVAIEVPSSIPDSLPKNASLLIKELKTPESNSILVIAHRGDWCHAPENSLPAIENSIAMGVDMVEIDIRETKDGQLVLMHDKTIDRTTTGNGLVADWTLDSLKTLYLRNGVNHPGHFRIPTLEEAMLTAKGRILVNPDKAYPIFDKVYQVLEKTGTAGQVVMKGKVPVAQVKAEFGDYLDKVIFMPVVDLDAPGARKIIEDYDRELKPLAYELLFTEVTEEVYASMELIRQRGSKVWVNSLWASLNGGYYDDMALSYPDSIYGWYTDHRVGLIQSDRPGFLIEYLRHKGLHR